MEKQTLLDRVVAYVFLRGEVTGAEIEKKFGVVARRYVVDANFGYNVDPYAARRYGLGQSVPFNKRPGLFLRLDDRRRRKGTYTVTASEVTLAYVRRALQRAGEKS